MKACVAVLIGLVACGSVVWAGTESIAAKLETIQLPDVQMNQMPIREALNTIREMAVAADEEDDPESKGVNVIFKGRGTEPIGDIKVTVDLKNPTLGQVFDEVARQTKYEVVIEPYAVALVPIEDMPRKGLAPPPGDPGKVE